MASITERSGRYLVRVRRDGYATVTKTFTKRSDGAAWGRKVEADMEGGRWVTAAQQVPTLRAAIGEYSIKVASKMKGYADYAYRLDQFAALAFAAKRVDEVTAYDLAAWRDDQAATLKAATVVRKLAMLSAIFTWCMKERGWLKVNPMALVAKPRVLDGRDRLLSADEQCYLLAAAGTSKATWLPSALLVLMHSAMRRGEFFGLQRQDVDYSAAIAQLHDTKNGRPRKVPLCPKSLGALRWLDAAAEMRGDGALLPVGVAGSISMRFTITVRRARQSYEADCAAKGTACDPRFLVDLRLHDLRHHAVTLWANRGLPMLELMAISGHLNPRMLARYAHINSSTLAGKLAALTEQAAAPLVAAC